MKIYYIRQTIRESYEATLVTALVASGFECTLSTAAEDELAGIDAWILDPKTQRTIPVDFFCGCERSTNLTANYGKKVLVLHIPEATVNGLMSSHHNAQNDLKVRTERALLQARFEQYPTRDQVKANVNAELRSMYYRRSPKVQVIAA